MTYAKYIDGHLEYAPRMVRTNKSIIYNPTEAILINLGYKPVYEEEMPICEEGYYCEPRYSETDEAITIGWEVVEDLYVDDSDYADVGKIMMGVI